MVKYDHPLVGVVLGVAFGVGIGYVFAKNEESLRTVGAQALNGFLAVKGSIDASTKAP